MNETDANNSTITLEERAHRWALWRLNAVGPRRLERIVSATDGAVVEVWSRSKAARLQLARELGLSESATEGFVTQTARDVWPEWESECEALPPDGRILHQSDPEYPDVFAELEAPPPFVYVRGRCLLNELPTAVAIVGSRKIDHEGVRIARRISREIAESGATIASGGAIGTDALAHEAALGVGAPTVVFLPSGIDVATPRRHRSLFERVSDNGVLVSEYPLGVTARRYHFHRRNDLIACFAASTLVVRARRKSGTLITARAALRLGRPLFVVPGSPEDPFSEGCLDLLVNGARPVRSAADLLDEVKVDKHESSAGRRRSGLTDLADRLLSALETSLADATVDELVATIGEEAGAVSRALLELELRGLVSREPGGSSYRAQSA